MTGVDDPGIEKARRSLKNARMSLEAGDFDFAASRAYYAMFYAAETLLSKLGLTFAKHSGVITEFNRRFIKTELLSRAHAEAFRKAFDLRIVGDYEYGIEVPRESAVEAIDAADAFLRDVETHLARTTEPHN